MSQHWKEKAHHPKEAHLIDDTMESVSKLVSDAQERVQETTGKVRHIAGDIADKAKFQAEHVRELIEEYPIRALLTGVGIGALVGMCFATLRKRNVEHTKP